MSADEDFDEDEEFVEGGPTRVAVVFETIFEARAPLRGALSRVAAHAIGLVCVASVCATPALSTGVTTQKQLSQDQTLQYPSILTTPRN